MPVDVKHAAVVDLGHAVRPACLVADLQSFEEADCQLLAGQVELQRCDHKVVRVRLLNESVVRVPDFELPVLAGGCEHVLSPVVVEDENQPIVRLELRLLAGGLHALADDVLAVAVEDGGVVATPDCGVDGFVRADHLAAQVAALRPHFH